MDQSSISGTARSILDLIKRLGQASVVSLSDELGLSGMAVRHHLSALRARGYIESTQERHGVGRPTEIFRLSEAGDELFPRHYDRLTTDILETIESTQGKEKTGEILSERSQRQLRSHSARLAGLGLEARVAELARILTEEGFLADFAEDGDEFVLTERNCAVSNVARQYPQLCQCEMNLIAELLEADVTRKEHKFDGDHCCSYVIRARGSAADQ